MVLFSEYQNRKRKQELTGGNNALKTVTVESIRTKDEAQSPRSTQRPRESSTVSPWQSVKALQQHYDQIGKFPEPLSPSLPPMYTEFMDVNNEIDLSDASIQVPPLLSPTLPPLFDKERADQIKQLDLEPDSPVKDTQLLNEEPDSSDDSGNPFRTSIQKAGPKVEVQDREGNDCIMEDINPESESPLRLSEKYAGWAQEQRRIGDLLRKENKVQESLLYFIDSINLFVFAFYYDDLKLLNDKKCRDTDNWYTLIELIEKVRELARNCGDVVLTGLCSQIACVVYEHMADVMGVIVRLGRIRRQRFIKQGKETFRVEEKMVEDVRDLMKFKELSKRSLVDSDNYFSVFRLMREYPEIVREYEQTETRSLNTILSHPGAGSPNAISSQGLMRLPITQCVKLEELVPYTSRVLKQWAQNNGLSLEAWRY